MSLIHQSVRRRGSAQAIVEIGERFAEGHEVDAAVVPPACARVEPHGPGLRIVLAKAPEAPPVLRSDPRAARHLEGHEPALGVQDDVEHTTRVVSPERVSDS